MRYFHRLLYLLFVLIALTGCARIPIESQFVSVQSGFQEVRNTGVCDEESFRQDGGITEVAQNGLSADRIPILNWNIYKGQEKGWQEDLLKFGGESDLILLQEALLNPFCLSLFLRQIGSAGISTVPSDIKDLRVGYFLPHVLSHYKAVVYARVNR